MQYIGSYFVSLYKMILNLTSKRMKKIILLIVVFCGFYMSVLFAQNNYNFSYNAEVYRAGFDPVKIKQDKNMAKVSFVNTDKKNKVTVQEKTFDEAGRILKHDRSDKKGILKTAFAYEYENDTAKNPCKIFVYSKSGELKTIVEYKMTKSGKISEYTTKYNDGNIIEKNLWFYNDEDQIVRSEKYSGGEKLKNVWLYTYNQNGKMAEAKLTNGKNKTEHVWTYDCNEEGVELEKEKDITQVCNWKKVDESYYITVYQTFDDKGKIRKYVSKFSAADSLIMESSTFDENDKLISKAVYDGNYQKILSYEYFKKGVMTYKNVKTYDGDLIKTNEVYTKKGFAEKTDYIYNDKKLLTGINKYDKENKLANSLTIEYVFR